MKNFYLLLLCLFFSSCLLDRTSTITSNPYSPCVDYGFRYAGEINATRLDYIEAEPLLNKPLAGYWNFMISPTLPEELVFNGSNGSISGIPQRYLANSTYIVVAEQENLRCSFPLRFGVNRVWTYPDLSTYMMAPVGTINDASSPQVAMNDNGDTVIVWTQADASYTRIFKSEYRNGVWTVPGSLANYISPDGSNASAPDVAIDNSGNTIVVWQQSDGVSNQIFKSEYRNGSWTYPAGLADNISVDGTAALLPKVAMDNNGNAIIVWNQDNGSNTSVFKSEYRNGTWVHPSTLAYNVVSGYFSPSAQNTSFHQVAMGDGGDAVIIWQESNGSNTMIFKSEYRNGAWIHPVNNFASGYFSPSGTTAMNPVLAMNSKNSTIIAWIQYDGSYNQIFKSEYHNGTWVHPTGFLPGNYISPSGGSANSPVVAMDNNDNAVIVWYQATPSNAVFKSEYRDGSWRHPSSLSDHLSPSVSVAANADVAMDNNGNAIIVWTQVGSLYNQVYKSEYRNGGWSIPTLSTDYVSPATSDVFLTKARRADDGEVVVIWVQSSGINEEVYKAEYR